MESFVLFSSVPQRRTAIGFYCSVWSILFNAFHSLAECACWKTNETTGMWENIKTMLKGRKLDINFKSHKKAKKSLSKNSHEKKIFSFCESMDTFKISNSHECVCSILQLTNHTYLSLDFTKALPTGLRAMMSPVLHDSSKIRKNLPGDSGRARIRTEGWSD